MFRDKNCGFFVSHFLEKSRRIKAFRRSLYGQSYIEQIWKEIRKRGFRNEIFQTLEKVVERLCDTICSLSNEVIKSITGRDWILSLF